MKHLSLIVPTGRGSLTTLASLIGMYEIFATANEHWQKKGNGVLFKIELTGISDMTEVYGHFSARPHVHIRSVQDTNLIIIPSLAGEYERALEENELFIDWIVKQYRNGAEVACICTGAFMLSSAGLLDGKDWATYWLAANDYKSISPAVNLQRHSLITDEKGIYTNGGAYSFLNLVIYLIEKFFDRETAIYCSKLFQLDMDGQNQSELVIFKGQKEHGDETVKKAQAYLEKNLQERMSMDDLCATFSISRRNFDRRFFKATGNTPLEYSQRVKIELAKKSFETTRKTIKEVMYEVGYVDNKAFRDIFKKYTNMLPVEYKRKYNKEMK
jgi:transcriptional regulator GlxA family with amidase domain